MSDRPAKREAESETDDSDEGAPGGGAEGADEAPTSATPRDEPTQAAPRQEKLGRVAVLGDLPPFARSFPDDPELSRLLAHFVAGDYAHVRAEAPRLAKRSAPKGAPFRESSADDEVRAAARELLRRIEPDPMAKWFVIGAFGLLGFLALWFWSHAHGGP